MCLITEQKETEILKEDLIVYKRFKLYKGEIRPWCRRFYEKFIYNVGKIHKQPLGIDNHYESHHDSQVVNAYPSWQSASYTHVHEGFHAALTYERLGKKGERRNNDTNVAVDYDYVCIIPKGAKVFKDKTGLIVTNTIILKEEICA